MQYSIASPHTWRSEINSVLRVRMKILLAIHELVVKVSWGQAGDVKLWVFRWLPQITWCPVEDLKHALVAPWQNRSKYIREHTHHNLLNMKTTHIDDLKEFGQGHLLYFYFLKYMGESSGCIAMPWMFVLKDLDWHLQSNASPGWCAANPKP